MEYKTSLVTRGDVTQIVTANGSLTPVQLVEVGSQISGVITEIKVDFNSRVKAGDIVAQIDPATYERAQGQAEAELASAEAAQELAQLNFDRGQGALRLATHLEVRLRPTARQPEPGESTSEDPSSQPGDAPRST